MIEHEVRDYPGTYLYPSVYMGRRGPKVRHALVAGRVDEGLSAELKGMLHAR